VDAVVATFADKAEFPCHVLHRSETLAAVDSWYSAVATHASEGEAVVLLGDDDLLVPWGLEDRYRELVRTQADMLLSDFADRLYFFDEARRFWMTGPMPSQGDQAKQVCLWEFSPAKHPEASFVSNHCYRNTPGLRRGLDLAFAWCDSQTWLARGVRTAMLPFYLPYAITLTGGRVMALHSKCVLRGACAEEAIRSAYADGGNVAFYGLCAYDIFANRSLPNYSERLSAVCARFRASILRGLLTIPLDGGITLDALVKTYTHAGLQWSDLLSRDVLHGITKVAVRLLGLRGARLRMMGRFGTLPRTESLFP
jgi:hypothetical protein